MVKILKFLLDTSNPIPTANSRSFVMTPRAIFFGFCVLLLHRTGNNVLDIKNNPTFLSFQILGKRCETYMELDMGMDHGSVGR